MEAPLAVKARQFHWHSPKVQFSTFSRRVLADDIPVETDGIVDHGSQLTRDDMEARHSDSPDPLRVPESNIKNALRRSQFVHASRRGQINTYRGISQVKNVTIGV
jgi:hypothetical protein